MNCGMGLYLGLFLNHNIPFLSSGNVIKDDIMLAVNFTPASNTAVTTEELLHSLPIGAGLVGVNNVLDIYSDMLVTGSVNAKIIRIYISSDGNLAGATKIATNSTVTATFLGVPIQRFFPVLSDTSIESTTNTTTNNNSSASNPSSSAPQTIAVPSLSAGFWILITGQKASAGETLQVRQTFVRNNTL